MLTPIPCPKCNVRLQTPANLLGKTINCPKCMKPIKLVTGSNGSRPAKPSMPPLESPDRKPAAAMASLEDDDFTAGLEQIEESEAPAEPKNAADEMEELMEEAVEEEAAEEAAVEEEVAEETVEEEITEEEVAEEAVEEEVVEETAEEEPVEEMMEETVEEEAVEEGVTEEPAAEEEAAVEEESEAAEEEEVEEGKLSAAVEKFLKPKLFLIKGQSGLFSMNAAWDFLNPDTKKKVGTAVERPEGMMQVLRFFLRRNWLPSKIEIREEKTNELVFVVKRPAYFFNCTLEVRDANNKLLAKFTYKPLSRMLAKPMPIERKGGEKFATCEFYFLKGRMDLVDDKKKELANMQTESAYTKAIKIYWAARGGSYYVTFNKPLFDKPLEKMIFLGVTLALDLLQEDAKASSGKGGGISIGT